MVVKYASLRDTCHFAAPARRHTGTLKLPLIPLDEALTPLGPMRCDVTLTVQDACCLDHCCASLDEASRPGVAGTTLPPPPLVTQPYKALLFVAGDGERGGVRGSGGITTVVVR